MAGQLPVQSAVLDGELVALQSDGVPSFPGLQTALSDGNDRALFFYVFDLLELNGWDLRPCDLLSRKAALKQITDWSGMLRYSEHVVGHADEMWRNACQMHLEGIVCKQAHAPYRAGRGRGWLKLKCVGRDELVVLGWTPPAGSRSGIGALHVGYFDPQHCLHYAGGVGTGFSDRELASLRRQLDELKSTPPETLLLAGDPLDRSIQWVRPELVVEVQYTDWSGAGRVRHPVYLGRREDKTAKDVVREIADPKAERIIVKPRPPEPGGIGGRRGWHGAVPTIQRPQVADPVFKADVHPPTAPVAPPVVTRTFKRARTAIGNVAVSNADRELWPSVTKRDLAEYWQAVAEFALPGLARRPLSIVRCPDGIQGEHFFQKNGHGLLPVQIRNGSVGGSPYLAIDDVDGLIALAQMSAIELHPWGASEADPLHPDRLVFDLDPGEGVAFSEVVRAAHDVRDRLKRLGLVSFCRTTGGKGLHVVVPLTPETDWVSGKAFCHAFAQLMSEEEPRRFLAHLKIADRRGRILVDWLRNGMGATAVSSFCPRARPGAIVATPLAWGEVKMGLDPAAFTIRSVPQRVKRLKRDPWAEFGELNQHLPDFAR
jgi:bifunctional non-homologous end joining protein LigD